MTIREEVQKRNLLRKEAHLPLLNEKDEVHRIEKIEAQKKFEYDTLSLRNRLELILNPYNKIRSISLWGLENRVNKFARFVYYNGTFESVSMLCDEDLKAAVEKSE